MSLQTMYSNYTDVLVELLEERGYDFLRGLTEMRRFSSGSASQSKLLVCRHKVRGLAHSRDIQVGRVETLRSTARQVDVCKLVMLVQWIMSQEVNESKDVFPRKRATPLQTLIARGRARCIKSEGPFGIAGSLSLEIR